jgi:hypothetical protein
MAIQLDVNRLLGFKRTGAKIGDQKRPSAKLGIQKSQSAKVGPVKKAQGAKIGFTKVKRP